MNQKFDFKDITLVPETLSTISSRNSINIYNEDKQLPIMVSPMDTVVDEYNCQTFLNNEMLVCLPRTVFYNHHNVFTSVSLEEFETIINWFDDDKFENENFRILVDIANGHMEKLFELSKKFVNNRNYEKHKLMVGNVANPKTYQKFAEIGVDFVRVGIGGGSGCLTSANTGIHYPMASLVHECYEIKKQNSYETKIIADGGFKNYDDIIKAIALGADYVMLGGVLNKTLESCSETKIFKLIPISQNLSNNIWENMPFMRKYMFKKFRGMSTKEVQRKWNKTKIKTSEGISKYNKVEYTLNGWTENFKDYLKSAMSYTNSKSLDEFKGSDFIFITQNSLSRFYK